MHGEFEAFIDGVMLIEEGVLRCQHSFTCHIVWIHSLPTAGQCASMEYHLDTKVIGICQYVLIELHGVLLVASKEIHLYTLHTYAFQPSHLLASGEGSVHALLRGLWRVAPC